MNLLFILAIVVVAALAAGITYVIAKNSFEKEFATSYLRTEKQHKFELDEKTAKAAKEAVAGLKAKDLAKILDELDDSNEDFYTYVAFLILEYQDLLNAKEEGKPTEEINKELLEVYEALRVLILTADDVVEDKATIKAAAININ